MKMYLILAAVCFVGCASSPKPESVPTPVDDPIVSWGEFCKETAFASCYKGSFCGWNYPSMGVCEEAFIEGCCGRNGVCSKTSNVLRSQTKTCANALRHMTCAKFNELADGIKSAIPSECIL